jgi:FtsZ-binding cell division protein ZapB
MVTLEQVKLLETKVAKAIDYVDHLTGENTMLKEKLSGYQTRIDELEVLIRQFKEDQGRIEGGILSALDRLNQFEDALERGVSSIIPKEDKMVPVPELPIEDPFLAAEETIILLTEKEVGDVVSDTSENGNESSSGDDLSDALFSETTPAADFDETSDDAAIMAALEDEEKAIKAKSVEQPGSELDIF